MFGTSIVALVTPMKNDGAIDFTSLANLLDFHIENQTDSILIAGSTGENITLTEEEIIAITEYTCNYVNQKKPIIVGACYPSTQKTIKLYQKLSEFNIQGLLSVTPYYIRTTQEGLYQHYKSLASKTHLPILIYEVPTRTNITLEINTIARLSQINNIIGIKDATGNLTRLPLMKRLCHKDFLYYSGDDATALPYLYLGGHGVISVANNIRPKLFKQMCSFAISGDVHKANYINSLLSQLYQALNLEPNPIPIKWLLKYENLIHTQTTRSPLISLSEKHYNDILYAVDNAKLQ